MADAMNGAILYQGPSMLDGAPIVAIATGLERTSENAKTGAMIQTWILRADESPLGASRNGHDSSICGGCAMRRDSETGRRRCYVAVHQAPLSVWKAFQAGRYSELGPNALVGRTVRVGSYGDPAAVPFEVWARALEGTARHTGYTHQWRDPRFAQFASILMASADLAMDVRAAERRGFRAFYVEPIAGDPTGTVEGAMRCPASRERKTKATCATCGACNGTEGRNKRHVVIAEH